MFCHVGAFAGGEWNLSSPHRWFHLHSSFKRLQGQYKQISEQNFKWDFKQVAERRMRRGNEMGEEERRASSSMEYIWLEKRQYSWSCFHSYFFCLRLPLPSPLLTNLMIVGWGIILHIYLLRKCKSNVVVSLVFPFQIIPFCPTSVLHIPFSPSGFIQALIYHCFSVTVKMSFISPFPCSLLFFIQAVFSSSELLSVFSLPLSAPVSHTSSIYSLCCCLCSHTFSCLPPKMTHLWINIKTCSSYSSKKQCHAGGAFSPATLPQYQVSCWRWLILICSYGLSRQ